MKSLFFSLSLITSFSLFASGPCRDDAQKFCTGAKGERKTVMKCLKEHESELSPACKERTTAFKEKIKSARANCTEDANKFCADQIPGKGAILKCLKAHKEELSEGCKAQMKK